MERQDAMTRRPSLLAGGPEPAAGPAPRERILPTIDAATPASPAHQPARTRRWLLLAGLVLVATAALWLGRPAPGADTALPAASPAGHAGPGQAAAATIIDDAGLPTEVALGPSPMLQPAVDEPAGDGRATPVGQPDSPFAALTASTTEGAGARNPFVTGRASASAPAAEPRPRPSAATGSTDAPALLTTLLGHIRTQPQAESGMDLMADQLATDGTLAAPRADGAGAEFRSYQIQMNLRECPPANTAEGVACRKKICEVYAGRDPACPAG